MKARDKKILLTGGLLLLGVTALLGRSRTGKADCSIPRGIRNNNPGNIKTTGSAWTGEVPLDQNTDYDCKSGRITKTFKQFKSYVYGVRAMLWLLRESYMKQQGLRTVRAIVNRYAPPSENITSAYVTTVANAIGVSPDKILDPTDKNTLRRLLQAMAKHENGRDAISNAQFDQAWQMLNDSVGYISDMYRLGVNYYNSKIRCL